MTARLIERHGLNRHAAAHQLTLLLLLVFAPFAPLTGQAAPLRMTFLDVGQGDAVLLQAPEGQTILIDAGPGSILLDLRALGVENIDLLVATHPHADHIGGMAELIESVPVRFYMDSGQPHTTATYARLLAALTRHPEITYLEAVPRTLTLGSVEVEVLPLLPVQSTDLNNRSVGLVIRYGDFSAFLSGDSERRELSYFVQMGVVPDVTVLKAPHHGSDNGFTPEFLRRARPEVVAISVGANNYGHPRPEALMAYASVAERVVRTDQVGSFVVRGFEDGRFEVMGGTGGTFGGRARAALPSDRRFAESMTPVLGASAPQASSAGLAVDVFADAPGNDHQNTNGEYVTITNRLDTRVSLAGWSLCDAARHCFRFPAGAVIPGAGYVTVFTGVGSSDGSRFFMGSRQAVWNNDGDVATLYDTSGAVMVRYRYE